MKGKYVFFLLIMFSALTDIGVGSSGFGQTKQADVADEIIKREIASFSIKPKI